MSDIFIEKVDEVHMRLHCDEGIAYELNDYFSFFAKNYKFMPKYKSGIWDGKIRLFNTRNNKLYVGLFEKLIYFCESREYTFSIDEKFKETVEKVDFDVKSYNPPFKPFDYQEKAIDIILNKKRRLILSPTSSGKSFIIYGAIRWLVENNKKVLLIVPTTSLVEQMVKDFKYYGWNADDFCHKIYSGKEKHNEKDVTVTTWQSVFKEPKNWFKDFDAVFVDEAHLAQADSIKGIMEKASNSTWRIGLTGTIEDTQTHKLVLQGLFGKIFNTIKTSELMDRGSVAELKIYPIVLKHTKDDCKIVSKLKYQGEIDTLINNSKRNSFICKLAMSREGNTLILYNYVSKHGAVLFKLLNDLNKENNKKIFFVHGDTSAQTREDIREYSEKYDNVIIVASYGTFSTGISIKNLDNAIFGHPFKGKIRNLQSIGRILRKANENSKASLYDIVDDYRHGSKENTTYKHFKDRLEIYEKENFKYKIKVLEL